MKWVGWAVTVLTVLAVDLGIGFLLGFRAGLSRSETLQEMLLVQAQCAKEIGATDEATLKDPDLHYKIMKCMSEKIEGSELEVTIRKK